MVIPELPSLQSRVAVIRQPPVYEDALVRESVRAAMAALGLAWHDLIRPGARVVLKPNFIRQSHTNRPSEWQQIITHPSVIEAVALEVAAALDGRGTITIADAPQTDSDFDAICRRAEIPRLTARLAREFPGVALEVLDLRREAWRTENGVVVERRPLPEDPRGYTLVNLAGRSFFNGKAGQFYGADYDTNFTAGHHSGGRHEYLLSRSVMDADVFINLPKLKTHKKVGVTLSLKNLVGINGDKNYLPHFCIGTPAEGGDEFPGSGAGYRFQSRATAVFKAAALRSGAAARLWAPVARRLGSKVFGDTGAVVRSGNWHGNDTTWRMVLDLNRALFGFDGEGQPRARPLPCLNIIDGIIAGEGNGPMEADALPCGVIIAGTSPAATDWTAARLIGFDGEKIPMIRESFAVFGGAPAEVEIVPGLGEPFHFRPHFGWDGHIQTP